MPNHKKNNDTDKSDKEYKLKEVSLKLDISESTVKKYLKDFSLEINGSGNKAVISEETFQALSEIAKLRANGLSIQEIKELKSQEPAKTILEEIEEEENIPIKAKPEKTPEDLLEIVTNGDLKNESVSRDVDLEEETSKEEDEKETEEEEEEGEGEGSASEFPRRRRMFNYRYVERQISNDSKKITWLKQRLRSPNISVQDKLLFEESLERRILFLDGWKHILRWISSK